VDRLAFMVRDSLPKDCYEAPLVGNELQQQDSIREKHHENDEEGFYNNCFGAGGWSPVFGARGG